MASNPLFYQCLSPLQLLPTGRPEARAPGNPCGLSVTHLERPVQATLSRTTPCCALLRRAGGAASAAREQRRGENAVWTSDPPAPEVGQTYARARELCQQAGETPQLLQVLFGSWQFYLMRGELHIAREPGERYLNLAQRQYDSASLLMAHWALGMTLFYLREFVPAQDHTERSLVLYNTQPPSPYIFLYGRTLGVAAWAVWPRFCGCLAIPRPGPTPE